MYTFMIISFDWLGLKYRIASTNCNPLCAKDQSFIRREVYDLPSWAVGSKPCSDGTLSHAFSANFPLSLKCLFILSCWDVFLSSLANMWKVGQIIFTGSEESWILSSSITPTIQMHNKESSLGCILHSYRLATLTSLDQCAFLGFFWVFLANGSGIKSEFMICVHHLWFCGRGHP